MAQPFASRLVNVFTSTKTKSRMRIICLNDNGRAAALRISDLARHCGWEVCCDCIEAASPSQACTAAHIPASQSTQQCDSNATDAFTLRISKRNQELAIKTGQGLRNLGNTCFVNSILQVLFHASATSIALLDKVHSRLCKSLQVFCALCHIENLAMVSKGARSSIVPTELIDNISAINMDFLPHQQQDVHDFLLSLFSLEQSSPLGIQIFEPFRGKLRSQITCVNNHTTDTFEEMLDLSVQIPPNAVALEECLDDFFKIEKFDASNLLRCDTCNDLVLGAKHFRISQMPKLLCVQLKRFTNAGTKISHHIEFPLTLKLGSYSLDREVPSFRLIAVLVHQGNCAHTGHYFTFVRIQRSSVYDWKRMDDESVEPVSEAEVLSQQAYMLFYEEASYGASTAVTSPPSTLTTDSSNSTTLPTSVAIPSSTNSKRRDDDSGYLAAEIIYQLAVTAADPDTRKSWLYDDVSFLTKEPTRTSIRMMSNMALGLRFDNPCVQSSEDQLNKLCASKPKPHPIIGPVPGQYWLNSTNVIEFTRDWQTSLDPKNSGCTGGFITRAVTPSVSRSGNWFVVAYEYGPADLRRFEAEMTCHDMLGQFLPTMDWSHLLNSLEPPLGARTKEMRRLRQIERRSMKTTAAALENAQHVAENSARRSRKRDLEGPEKRPSRKKPRIFFDDFSAEDIIGEKNQLSFEPIAHDQKEALLDVLLEDLGSGMEERICCVCDTLHLKIEITGFRLHDRALPLANIQARLKPRASVPEALLVQYRIDCPELHDLVLSPRGASCISGEWSLEICHGCLASLTKSQPAAKKNHPPKFAIANGFIIGTMPEDLYNESTWVEKELCRLAQCQVDVRHLQGGAQRAIRSHGLTYFHEPSAPVGLLPRSLDSLEDFKVILAGPMTSHQKVAAKTQHHCRKQKVKDLLDFCRENNVLYKNVEVDMCILTEDSGLLPGLADCTEEGIPTNNLDESITTHPRMATATNDDDETTFIEHNKGVFEQDPSAKVQSQCLKTVVEELVADLAPSCNSAFGTAQPTFVVRRSNILLPSNAKNLLAMLFFELFPFGFGALNDPGRVVPVGTQKCFEHYLRLSSRRFAQHSRFLLFAFDHVGRSRCMTSMSLRCRLNPIKLVDMMHVTPNELRDHLQRQVEYLNDCRRGAISVPRVTHDCEAASSAMSFLSPSAAKMWGSNDERQALQSKAFALWSQFGQPTLFVTFNPHDVGSLTVCAYAGHFKDFDVDLAHEPCVSCDQCQKFPTLPQMFRLVARDPCATARYFHRVNEIFIKRVLGWDKELEKSFANGGLFGKCAAYLGSVETQGKGTLHTHYLIWLDELPKTLDQLREACVHEDFRQKIVLYFKSIVSHEYPVTKFFRDPVTGNSLCPHCRKSLTIQLLDSDKLRQRPTPNRPRPAIAKCSNCNKSFTYETLFTDQCAAIQEQLKITEAECDLRMVDMVGASVKGLNLSESAVSAPTKSDLMVSKILFYGGQTHDWKHRDSCFKSSARLKPNERGKLCRFLRPHKTQRYPTYYDRDNDKIVAEIPNGCEYLNGHNDVITCAFKVNHDVQLVLTGGPGVVYYAIKYSTKAQQSFYDTQTAALTSLENRIAREGSQGDDTSAAQRASGRYMSMLYGMTGRMEISAPLAAFFFLNEGPGYLSHTFANLLISQAKALASGVQMNCTVETNKDGTASVTPQIFNYLFRPKSLDRISFHSFIARFDKVRLSLRALEQDNDVLDESTLSNDEAEDVIGESDVTAQYADTGLRFLEGHPQVTSHGLRRFRGCRVVNVMGAKLKDFSELENDEDRNKYHLHVLILFFPFRNFEEIGGGVAPPLSSTCVFKAWKESGDLSYRQAARFIEFNNAYHTGKREAKEAQALMNNGSAEGPVEVGFGEMMIGNLEDSDLSDVDDQGDIAHVAHLHNLFEQDEEMVTQMDNTEFNPDADKTTLASLLSEVALGMGSHDSRLPDSLSSNERGLIRSLCSAHNQNILLFQNEAAVDNIHSSENEDLMPEAELAADLFAFTSLPTSISVFDSAITDSIWMSGVDFVAEPRPIGDQASIREVSQAYSLNKLQHVAFKLVGTALLNEFKADARCVDEKPEQVICYLGGAGGTGKSRVIKALLGLQESWGQDGRIKVCAPTGIAAVLVDGLTLHSLLEFLPQNMGDQGAPKRYSTAKMLLFSRVRLLIIDEVSMLSCRFLAQIDERLRTLCDCEKPFGGLHVILAGDLCQLEPVLGSPVYKKSKSSMDQAGHHLWEKSVSFCILLEENMRFLKDPEWGKLLERARVGAYTDEDMEIINSRLVVSAPVLPESAGSSDSKSKPASLIDSIRPVITTSNATRHKFNKAIFTTCASVLPDTNKPIRILARICKSRNVRRWTFKQFKNAYQLPDEDTGNLPMILDLFVGCPVMFTKNEKEEKRVANGSVGVVVGFGYPSNEPSGNYIGCSQDGVFVPACQPDVVFVKVLGKEHVKFHHNSSIGIFPLKRKTVGCTVKFANYEFGFSISQFSLVQAFAATVFKVQGLSLKDLTIADWKEQGCTPKKGSAYVALSRAEARKAVRTLHFFNRNHANFFKPCHELLNELERLRRLHNTTLEKLEKVSQSSHVQHSQGDF